MGAYDDILNEKPKRGTYDDILEAQPKAKAPSGYVRGLRDPVDAGAQMLTQILPKSVVESGNKLNNWLADKTGLVGRLPEGGVDQQVRESEHAYQAQRAAAGETGMDWDRMAGNVFNPLSVAAASRIPQAATMGGRVALGAGTGAMFGAAQPVTQGDFWTEKGKQAGIGAITGAALPAVTGAAARVVSPKASVNPDLKLLRESGVKPTVGQTLGGVPNWVEQRAMSMPLVGDAIANARSGAVEQFNRAALNRAVAPIGGQIDDIGHAGIAKAGDMLSKAYDDALKGLKGVSLDQQGAAELASLRQMAGNLPQNTGRQFNAILRNVVDSRMSPKGGMAAATFKKVESELSQKAARYSGSSVASEQELGSALNEALRILREQAARQNPQYAAALKAANEGWANLIRVEGAGVAAKGADGVFTPGQLLTAVRGADKSVRDRATARGTALMQDLAGAGQRVLGNTIPNSGTADRAAQVGMLASGIAAPIPTVAALTGGTAMYTPQVQKVLNLLFSGRPQAAIPAAQAVRNSAPFLAPGVVPLGYGLLGSPQ